MPRTLFSLNPVDAARGVTIPISSLHGAERFILGGVVVLSFVRCPEAVLTVASHCIQLLGWVDAVV